MKKLLFAYCMFLLSCKENFTETVISVKDGDTVVLSSGEVIRLEDCDAPELHQAYGLEAKNFTSTYLLNKKVNVKIKEKDKYGREVASIFIEGANFSELLVSEGLAHVNEKYCRNQALISEYEAAQSHHAGLFQSNYILPYQFRKKSKLK